MSPESLEQGYLNVKTIGLFPMIVAMLTNNIVLLLHYNTTTKSTQIISHGRAFRGGIIMQ